MKSIKFRKMIQKINKITRKRQNKKYKGASQKSKSVKMSSSRKKTKTRTKTKKYYHKGGEPTKKEKEDFYSKIDRYIKSENYIELIGMLTEETNVDLFNEKVVIKNDCICAITREEFKNNETRIICSYCYSSFTKNAIKNWFSSKHIKICPYCRTETNKWYINTFNL